MVPKGWKKNSLDSLFEFKNGLNTEKEQYGNGYKFVNVMDVFRNDILTESKIIGRVQVTDKQLEGYQLKYGDVLFNRTSETFDEIAIAAIYLDNAIATFGGFVIRARPKGNQIDPAYSVFLFQSKSYRSQVVKLGQGAIRANIGQKDLARVCILVPPLAEQKKIAQILSTWDKAISVTEKLLANSQQQKKALMQQLLTGKKRLLDENGVRFSGEWKQDVNLGSIINISKGVQINKNTLSEDGQFPVINGGIAPSGFTSEFNTDENTITISEGGNSCGYVAFQKKSFWCGGHSYAVRKTALDLSFTFHLLKYNELKIMGLRVGSGLPNIQKKAIEAFTVNFPVTSVEQQKIAAVLSAADDEIATLEKKLACLRDEKKALMQQLLTGKRRVKVDEAVAE
ncbi:restriction endonuclease subunit S [Escherichia coli]|nr:restriction endonuclease subunit S [Escherichia coli]MDF6590024.1 restriction endonuclease subunit S [Escherichia coli]HAM7460710.1 restriction endonuclease subunit S [Escherichia coli]HDX2601308.1 restriction endonuclease subunit S [Escherichia coli]HDX2667487.1 restriction endonuclease subunit S [Escherichia coli]